MQIKNIYSTRKSNSEVYSDLIYEWEDCIAQELGVPIFSSNKIYERISYFTYRIAYKIGLSGFLQSVNRLISKPNSYTLIYHLFPVTGFGYKVFSDKVPYLIDFDKNIDIDNFSKVYKNCKLILVSSLNAYNLLKQGNCPLNIVHLPLGLSNSYQLWKDYKGKKYDAIFVRKNRVLQEYAERYALSHPNFNYVFRTWSDNNIYRNNVYVSNLEGVLGEFSDRKEYINLLRSSKIAFYSTPGTDEVNSRFINHVTPSLFEFIVNGCRIVARYTDNEETRSFGLSSIAESITSYEIFEKILTEHINDETDNYLIKSEEFLKNIYMSNIIEKLRQILKKY
ncbi:hypothetical protein [Mucilaginibacter jinjuensis]|uniref:Glycosyl transferase family 1 n=1 Tax=Mucilaginibacter jinjuensis TaxID=1176721 RepID=A0ABY7TAF1_9SPHI|nr:hypothetical protein [Mucilaginibacter jinjuensis]WCT13164.1 hypothetical protein PQO05_04355 [Mucilaginibacter jinjuensis]